MINVHSISQHQGLKNDLAKLQSYFHRSEI